MNKCYSHDEESFWDDVEAALEHAVDFFLDGNDDFEGETEIELFEAEKVNKKISDFVPWFADGLTNNCHGEHDEYSDEWCEKIEKRAKEIQEIVKSALNKWADENNMQPNFYGVKNVRPIAIKIKIDKEGNWEEIKP